MPGGLRKVILKCGGALLFGLGILHLAVSPIIGQFIKQNTIPGEVDWFMPPMMLNHVVVGILLLPLAFLTYYAASPAIAGDRWALVVVRTSAISTTLLGAVLFTLMRASYFAAVLFTIASVIVSLASILLLVAAFWPTKSSAA